MKRLFTSLFAFLLLFAASTVFAQDDILLEQDFQIELIEGTDYQIFPDAPDSDGIWISFDEDGVDDANARPVNWFQTTEVGQALSGDSIPPADTNFVFASSSWLSGFDTSNSNWLITPLLEIGDDQATLHWKSATRQGPRYMDGYAVKVLVGDSDPGAADVTFLWRAAEMLSFGTGDGTTLDPNDYEMSNGYVHGDNFTLIEYFYLGDTTDTAYIGNPEPHSLSLADFAGQSIYIAFHHDSADDNFIEVDDIVVMGNIISSTKVTENDIRFVTYPNPVDNFLNVMFRIDEAAEVNLELYNQNGQLVAAKASQDSYVGEYTEQFDLRRMAAGTYNVVLTIDGQRFTKSVVRK